MSALNIDELADLAGLTRRAIRFYVQRNLISPPRGVGRGRHYDREHVEQLRRIRELQAAGHSLDAIGKILRGQEVAPPGSDVARRPRALLTAELWTRLRVAEGIELHWDTRRLNPTAEKFLAMRDAIRAALNEGDDELDKNRHEDAKPEEAP